jgi:two-component system, NarL family, sensor histidine kinase DesK
MGSGRGWSGTLLDRPWLLVLAVALLVAMPVLLLGQASENDTRGRVTTAQVHSAAHEADVVSSSFNEREELLQATVAALALKPRPDGSPIGLAVQRGDVATLQALVDTVQRLYARNILRAYIAVRGEAETIDQATIVVASPTGTGLVGQRVPSDALKNCRRGCNATDYFVTGGVSDDYPGAVDAPSQENIAATIPGPGPDAQRRAIAGLAQIVAELDLARLFADAAAPSLAPGDDAYLLDGQRRLVGRVRGPTTFPLRDLSSDAFVQLIGPTSAAVARAGAKDPLGEGTRLIASAPVAASSWSILVLRDTSAVDQEVDGALSQLASFRLVLVGLVLGLAYLIGLAGRQLGIRAADRERLRLARDLHDLLGHSLSLITIKSQLARRLLAPGDSSRVATEIADIERVARESLQDVRHAVDGYRQPSLTSALASARAGLAAAGIDSTIAVSAGPLPTEVDEALAWTVREGVTNVIRHSKAATCSIRLTREGRVVRLEITDDGPLAAMRAPGSGLRGLDERVAARGGHADAGPVPNGGFRVRVTIPL